MSKTKSQLRAEAVERLRKLNCMDIDCYQLLEATVDDAGEKVGYRVEIRKLIDLLEDEPMDARRDNDGTCPDADGTASIEQGDDGVAKLDAQARAEIEDAERSRAVSGDAAAKVDADTGGTEKTPQEPRECGRITFTDTRERLEADVRKWFAYDYYDDYYSEEDMNSVVSKWLDRQAAITEREYFETKCYDCQDAHDRQTYKNIERYAELKEQLDTMRDVARKFRVERDELKERVDNLCASEEIGNKLIMAQLETEAERGRTIVEYAEKVAELEAELDTKHGALNGVTLRDLFGIWKDTSDELEPSSNQLEPDTRENLGSNLGSGSEVGSEVDSREKLEAEIRYEYNGRIEWDADQIIGWLDRQAAITQAEDERTCHDCTMEQVEALQERVDMLEAEKRECMEDCANRVSAALVERDRYREKLGRALDAAHEVVRMMEVDS